MQPSERNSSGNNEWRLEKVDDFSIFIDFECGDNDLNDFIRHDAVRHRTELLAETYALKEATVKSDFPVAFVSFVTTPSNFPEAPGAESSPRRNSIRFSPR